VAGRGQRTCPWRRWAIADRSLGVIREGSELRSAAAGLSESDDGEAEQPASLMALLLCEAALRRAESRGGHFRSDFPETAPEWRVRQVVSTRGWARLPVPDRTHPAERLSCRWARE
jgi:aspartate oxidase